MVEQLSNITRLIRLTAVITMFTILVIGSPKSGVAFFCENDLIQCHDNADDCVANANEECEAYGQPECPGQKKCLLGSEEGCHPNNPFAESCVPLEPH